MLAQFFEEASLAASAGDEHKLEHLIHQIAGSSQPDLVDSLLQTFRGGTKLQHYLAIRVLQCLGFPKNEPAIPELISHLGDPNTLGWREAAETLHAIDPDMLLPYLLCALLDQEAFRLFGRDGEKRFPLWGRNVEGVCSWLMDKTVDQAYARRCCPAVIFLLSQTALLQEPGSPNSDHMLEVVEKAAVQDASMIPSLLALAKRCGGEFGERAKRLLSAFKPEALAPYRSGVTPLPLRASARPHPPITPPLASTSVRPTMVILVRC